MQVSDYQKRLIKKVSCMFKVTEMHENNQGWLILDVENFFIKVR